MSAILPQAITRPIDWDKIDTVFLDMDGTLLDLAFDNWFWQQHLPQVYAAHKQLPLESASVELLTHIDSHMGTLSWYSTSFWSRETGLDIMALKREVSARIRLRPNALTLLDALKTSGRRILMTTNADREVLALKLTQTGIAPYFDALVSSHDYGAAKESQAFWQQLQREHPFDATHTLLLDDSLAVLTSAQTYGLAHLCSIRQPDSSQPARAHTQPFVFVDDLSEALP